MSFAPQSSPLKPLTNNVPSPQKRLRSDSPIRKSAGIDDILSYTKPVLRFKKVSEDAVSPSKGSKLAAGYDLCSAQDCLVPARGKSIIKTGIQIELPPGCYGRIAPRSGLAAKHFIDVGAGVIDEDYRGDVGVVLFNFNSEEYQVKRGDRIAQLICERIFYPTLEEVSSLSETDRGAGGYGSTGKN